MSQTSDDTRVYSSWNRTPGKPNSSSSYLNTKMSNISSSTDSGVGRTPNWNSDTDCKFGLIESNPWSNNNVIQSPDSADSLKKMSWEENSSKITNNLTFGFSSQWSAGNDVPLSSGHNLTWGLPPTSPGDHLTNESSKLDNCWNLPSCQPGENYLPRSGSIWSTGAHRMYSDHDSDQNVTTTSSTLDLSSSAHNYQSVISVTSTRAEFDAKGEMPFICAFNNDEAGDKMSESKTWAQAAGKGLRDVGGRGTSASSDDECGGGDGGDGSGGSVKKEMDEEYQIIINRVEGWGSHTVDQSTPWVTEDAEINTTMNVCGTNDSSNSLAALARSSTESNVWTNEPPNGVGVWEAHYENIGEKTSRWNNAGGSGASTVKTKSGWELPETVATTIGLVSGGVCSVGGQWGERDCDSSVWSAATNQSTETRLKTPWMAAMPKQDSQTCLVAPIGSRATTVTSASHISNNNNNNFTQPQNFPMQRNNSALVTPMPPAISSDLGEPLTRQFYPSQMMANNNSSINHNNGNNSNRSNPSAKMRPMMNLGFRKEDAQCALNSNCIDMNRAMNQSSINPMMMNQGRNEWDMQPENYRGGGGGGSGDMNTCMMGGNGSGYMQAPQSMVANGQSSAAVAGSALSSSSLTAAALSSSSSMKHIQQQMQQMQQMPPMGQRMTNDNPFMAEKQIIKELNQLQAKQQDLIQRITALRSIAGSQAIIMEMSRTLIEVRQQLITQQATLKVIRRDLVPNGAMCGGSGSSSLQSMYGRTMQPQVPQSAADLSLHMADMKIQKRNMDLWPTGNLPSPNTISPYMAMDKPAGMFYNPANQMNGLMSQSFGCNKSNFVQPPSQQALNHRGQNHPGSTMWPSRGHNDDNDSNMSMMGSYDGRHNTSSIIATTTSALSLSQPLSSGISVSSAFNTRDVSFASANISEFVPGQPWPGISYSQRDDPNMTLGTGQRSLLSVTNDHLEKLTHSNVNSLMTSHDVGVNNNMNRLPSGANGAGMTYVLIRDLPSHINIEMLRNGLTSQSFPGLIQMHPNLAARWVLLHFTTNEETLKAFKNLYGKVGVVELVPDQEVNQRIQYSNCAAGPVIPPCSGIMDFHNQQSQSHYLH